MEAKRFDHLARLVAGLASRRSVIRGAAAGGLASALGLVGTGIVPGFGDEAEAGKRKRRRKRRDKKKKRREKRRVEKCEQRCTTEVFCEEAFCNKKGKCKTRSADTTAGDVCGENGDCCSGACACGGAGADQCLATNYEQGFEDGLEFWFDFSDLNGNQPPNAAIERVASGTEGINAKSGEFFALVNSGDHYQDGITAFSTLGGYSNVFPAGGWKTSIDVYLDPAGTEDTEFFAYTVAQNSDACVHIQDFIFYAGKTGTDYCVSTGTGVNSNTDPCDGNEPITSLTEAGWFTLQHVFTEEQDGVEVTMSLLDAGGDTVKEWTFPVSQEGEPGGNRYGWFPVNKLPFVAIDNSTRNS